MPAALCHELLAFALALAPGGFRPRPRQDRPPAGEGAHHLWSWIDDHGGLLYPLIGLALVALIVSGIRRGMTTKVAELQERQVQKDEIVRRMRARLLVSPEQVAVDLGIDHFTASALLDELVREGKLVQQKVLGEVASYRLKGW